MKITEQSHKIWPEGNPLEDIEMAGRTCYQSIDKIKNGSAEKFCKGIIKRTHSSVLEFATVHIKLFPKHFPKHHMRGSLDSLLNAKYLICNEVGPAMIVTGSVRAFREYLQSVPNDYLKSVVYTAVSTELPELFEDICIYLIKGYPKVVAPHELPEHLRKDHIHRTVSLITNRAIGNQVVRHRPCSFLQESLRFVRYDDGIEVISPSAFYEEGSQEWHDWRASCKFSEYSYLNLLKRGKAEAARTVLPLATKTELLVRCSLTQWEHIFALRLPKDADPAIRQLLEPLYKDMQVEYPGYFDNCKRRVG